MKIYWSGAALFLFADVELRRRSGGTETLDTVLDRFQSCCLPSKRSWSAAQLFDAFDTLIDRPLFSALYREHADAPGFPPFQSLLARLGVRSGDTPQTLDSHAELADIRAAITARRYTDPKID
jgi:predicted metalloprotease with PDZ domain